MEQRNQMRKRAYSEEDDGWLNAVQEIHDRYPYPEAE